MKKNSLLFVLLSIFLLSGGIILAVYAISSFTPNPSPSPSSFPSSSPTSSPTPTISQSPSPTPVPPEIVWGNTSKKQVVFTFDGGSTAQSLPAILQTLKKYGVEGTFFLTGKWAEQNPLLVKQISQEGHEIFNHTYSHPHLPQLSREEILAEFNRTEEIIKNLTGKTTKPYFRPPFGDRDAKVKTVASEGGYRSVYWTVDALDWKESEGFVAQQAKDRILTNLQPGTIYLMHIGDGITGEILDQVFSEIQSQGYSIVSLSEGVQ